MTSPKRQTATQAAPASNKQGEDMLSPQPLAPNPAPIEIEPKLQLERVGDMLKRVRLERGDDLQQIADYLCIRHTFLVALENSRYDELPADAYVIGFLRSYANFLGIDGKEAVDRYRNEMAGRRKKPTLIIPTPISEGRTPSAVIMTGAAIAAFMIYALWYGLSASDRTVVSTPPSLPSSEQSENVEAPVANSMMVAPAASLLQAPTPSLAQMPAPMAAAPIPTPAPTTETKKIEATQPPVTAEIENNEEKSEQSSSQIFGNARDSRMTIKAEQSSWISITDSKGRIVFDRVLKPGDVYYVPKQEGLSLTTGNSTGLILTRDGALLPRLSVGQPKVMRDISLDTEELRSNRALREYP